MSLVNDNYKAPDVKTDNLLLDLAERIQPFVRQIHLSWGLFSPQKINLLNAQTPCAILSRASVSQMIEPEEDKKASVMNYHIIIIVKDDTKSDLKAELLMAHIETSLLNLLQDYAPHGHRIQKLEAKDITTTDMIENNQLALQISLQLPFRPAYLDENLHDFLRSFKHEL